MGSSLNTEGEEWHILQVSINEPVDEMLVVEVESQYQAKEVIAYVNEAGREIEVVEFSNRQRPSLLLEQLKKIKASSHGDVGIICVQKEGEEQDVEYWKQMNLMVHLLTMIRILVLLQV